MTAIGDQRPAAALFGAEGKRRARRPRVRRTAARDVAVDAPEHARRDHRLQHPRRTGKTPHHRHRQHAIGSPRCLHHRIAIGNGGRQRLFHQDVQTRREQRFRRAAMEMRGQRHHRRFGMIRRGSDLGRDMRHTELFGEAPGAVLVAIDQRGHPHLGADQRARQMAQLGDGAATDDGYSQGFHGRLFLQSLGGQRAGIRLEPVATAGKPELDPIQAGGPWRCALVRTRLAGLPR